MVKNFSFIENLRILVLKKTSKKNEHEFEMFLINDTHIFCFHRSYINTSYSFYTHCVYIFDIFLIQMFLGTNTNRIE